MIHRAWQGGEELRIDHKTLRDLHEAIFRHGANLEKERGKRKALKRRLQMMGQTMEQLSHELEMARCCGQCGQEEGSRENPINVELSDGEMAMMAIADEHLDPQRKFGESSSGNSRIQEERRLKRRGRNPYPHKMQAGPRPKRTSSGPVV